MALALAQGTSVAKWARTSNVPKATSRGPAAGQGFSRAAINSCAVMSRRKSSTTVPGAQLLLPRPFRDRAKNSH
jgi:hypothetical protein